MQISSLQDALGDMVALECYDRTNLWLRSMNAIKPFGSQDLVQLKCVPNPDATILQWILFVQQEFAAVHTSRCPDCPKRNAKAVLIIVKDLSLAL